MSEIKSLGFTLDELKAGVSLTAGRTVRIVIRKPGDRHVLAVQVKSIGDTPLVKHPVRIFSLATGEQVSEGETDDTGLLRAEVPAEGDYRLELADEALGLGGGDAASWVDEQPVSLLCAFTDASGAPLAGEAVEATSDGETLHLETDAAGRVLCAAFHAPYELKLRGQTFLAHALPARDHPAEGAAYRFVVETNPGAQDA